MGPKATKEAPLAVATGGGERKQPPAQVKTAEAKHAKPPAAPLSWYVPGRRIVVNDKMQKNYAYTLTEKAGHNFAEGFRPHYTPAAMLAAGVFEGKYLNDCRHEFPKEWYETARLSPEKADPSLNALGVKSRLSLQEWRKRRWIYGDDVRGWFQWYCRYWLGRRDAAVDAKQIARWKSFKRHQGAITTSYKKMAASARPKTKAEKQKHRAKQRQALLQWAYDPYV